MPAKRCRSPYTCPACGVVFEMSPSRAAEQLFCSNECRQSPAAARVRLAKKVVVDEATGCWNWTGGIDSHGYSVASRSGKTVSGHRLSYELHVGQIPDDRELDHLCRNRRCVNPQHLEAVDRRTNILRGTTPKVLRRHEILGTKKCACGRAAIYWNGAAAFCRECNLTRDLATPDVRDLFGGPR
jgi:hypothetical protein